MTDAEAESQTEVRIRAASDGRYALYVSERQFHLLRRAAITLADHETSPAVRQLVLGPGGVSLDEPLQLGLSYDDAVPGPVTLTFEQLHALHAVLTTLPAATIWPEPEFVERVGDFRETVLRMAGLLRWAFREQPVAEKEHGRCARVRVRRTDEEPGRVLSPGSDQPALLRRCTDAFHAEMPDRAQRDFVLGEHGESLPALFAADPAVAADTGLPMTEGALRAAHTLLVTLLALIPSERVFMERTGHYRDHVTAVAHGLRRAASGQ